MASTGPVAIVTGAAQGIGFAISDRFLQEGYRVCLTDINETKIKEALAELQKMYASDKLLGLQCDVTSETNFRDVFLKTQQAFGRIDCLVNNAGIANEQNASLTVATNLLGPIFGCQLAVEFMGTGKGGKGGIVVNVASIAGLIPAEHIPVYTATKHGVVGLTRSYGSSDRHGIIFMAICPHYVRTQLLQTGTPAKGEEFQNREAIIAAAMPPEFVAEGVMKLLKEKKNGATMMVLPGEHIYVELDEKLKSVTLQL